MRTEQHFIGQKGLHVSSQMDGHVMGVIVVGSVVGFTLKFGQHFIGQFGSHFCVQMEGHGDADVAGDTVVVVFEQHFAGHIDKHVVRHTEGHPDGPRLQHFTGQKDKQSSTHISGHGESVGLRVVDISFLLFDSEQQKTGQEGRQLVSQIFGHVALPFKPVQHFTGQSGLQFSLQSEGQDLSFPA